MVTNEKFGPNGDAVASFIDQLSALDSSQWSELASHISAHQRSHYPVLKPFVRTKISGVLFHTLTSGVGTLWATGRPFAEAEKTVLESEMTRSAVELASRAIAAPDKFSREALDVIAEQFEPVSIDVGSLIETGVEMNQEGRA